MNLFYTPKISSEQFTLSEFESKHCARVLRLQVGAIVYLIDGKGGVYKAEITNSHHKNCTLRVLEHKKNFGKRPFSLHIGIAPTKNISRFEWFLEKATEIGIETITPLLCEHSERKIIKLERLEKLIVAAMKQSKKAFLPKLNSLKKFNDFISESTENQKFIAHCASELPFLKKEIKPQGEILILVGPEGDFSPAEIELAKRHDFRSIGLSNSILRTETAGIAACHTVSLAATNETTSLNFQAF